MYMLRAIVLVFSVVFLGACSHIEEGVKFAWGSSTRNLKDALVDAISMTYTCSFEECYEAALSLDKNEPNLTPQTAKFYNVFLKDPIKSHIVVMGVPGNVDTTEVGIFFTRLSSAKTKMEISSLSETAKEKVAQALMDECNMRFSNDT